MKGNEIQNPAFNTKVLEFLRDLVDNAHTVPSQTNSDWELRPQCCGGGADVGLEYLAKGKANWTRDHALPLACMWADVGGHCRLLTVQTDTNPACVRETIAPPPSFAQPFNRRSLATFRDERAKPAPRHKLLGPNNGVK